MGRHSEWRKLAKKFRRKRIRCTIAAARFEKEESERKKRVSSPSYQKFCEEQKALELFLEQEELRLSKERQTQWLKREEEAQKQWRELQAKLAKIRLERAKQEERIREEWRREQQQIKDAKERIQRMQEEKQKKFDAVRKKIDEFIANGGTIPEELDVQVETNPNKVLCPFFLKTGACRFKDACSRNHIRPGISKTLLFPSFYSHFSLDHTAETEYGSDSSLEYDERDTYNHFLDFFNDVFPELEKFGPIQQFKVSCNREPHLRGNVYVEYSSVREALAAYKTFQGRWYGGKQLNVEFCNISSWKAAICGLSFRKKCPKGSSCNFLHVFINPGKMYCRTNKRAPADTDESDSEYSEQSSRNWRWSESPENDQFEKENRERKINGKNQKSDDNRKRKRSSRSSSHSSSHSSSRSSSRTSSHSKSNSESCSEHRKRKRKRLH